MDIWVTRHLAGFLAVAMLLGLAYSASIGGLATLIGTPPNALLVGFMAIVGTMGGRQASAGSSDRSSICIRSAFSIGHHHGRHGHCRVPLPGRFGRVPDCRTGGDNGREGRPDVR